jgi:hypothetical protein
MHANNVIKYLSPTEAALLFLENIVIPLATTDIDVRNRAMKNTIENNIID